MFQYCDPGVVDFQPGAFGAQQPSKMGPILLDCVGSFVQDAYSFRPVFLLWTSLPVINNSKHFHRLTTNWKEKQSLDVRKYS